MTELYVAPDISQANSHLGMKWYKDFFYDRTRNDCFILFWMFGTFRLFSLWCKSNNSEVSFYENSVLHKMNVMYATSLSPWVPAVAFYLCVNNAFSVNVTNNVLVKW